jgi:hypothetical protein
MSNDPTDDPMQQQTLKTLEALEKMANAVTAYLTADKQPAEAPEERASKASADALDEMGKVVAKHHKALALLVTFGMMKDKPMWSAEPADEIGALLGMKACRNCVGTGWFAGDETCGECKGSGFLKA